MRGEVTSLFCCCVHCLPEESTNQQSEPTVLGNSSVRVAMQDEGFCYVVVSWGGGWGGGQAKS